MVHRLKCVHRTANVFHRYPCTHPWQCLIAVRKKPRHFSSCPTHPSPVLSPRPFPFLQIEQVVEYYSPKACGHYDVRLKRPLRCSECRGWFDGPLTCTGCDFLAREVKLSWSYWQWAVMAQVHNLLKAAFRERRGVVTLLGVPPAVGFALLKHFAWPNRLINRGGAVYTAAHHSWKQGTSVGKKWHFIKFASTTT